MAEKNQDPTLMKIHWAGDDCFPHHEPIEEDVELGDEVRNIKSGDFITETVEPNKTG